MNRDDNRPKVAGRGADPPKPRKRGMSVDPPRSEGWREVTLPSGTVVMRPPGFADIPGERAS